jgi:hypothetical protein
VPMKTGILSLLLLLAAPLSQAQEQAFANRATEVKERAAADSRTVGQLREGAEVRVMERASGFARVEGTSPAGWVRVFHLRFPATTQATAASGSTILSSAANALSGRSRSQEATIATTGVRGLSPEDLKNASPNAQALRQAQGYRADRAAAERFAREGKLVATQVDEEGGSR